MHLQDQLDVGRRQHKPAGSPSSTTNMRGGERPGPGPGGVAWCSSSQSSWPPRLRSAVRSRSTSQVRRYKDRQVGSLAQERQWITANIHRTYHRAARSDQSLTGPFTRSVIPSRSPISISGEPPVSQKAKATYYSTRQLGLALQVRADHRLHAGVAVAPAVAETVRIDPVGDRLWATRD